MILKYQKGVKTPLSPNFNSDEFDCACSNLACKNTLIDEGLIKLLEKFRTSVGTRININSGYRCEAHNAAVGGEEHSQHILGTAADISRSDKILWCTLEKDYAEEIFKNGGLGTYITPANRYLWLHVDSRNGKARWQIKV
jgi:zinc D-Ala-D-Ala carboxypeptidase